MAHRRAKPAAKRRAGGTGHKGSKPKARKPASRAKRRGPDPQKFSDEQNARAGEFARKRAPKPDVSGVQRGVLGPSPTPQAFATRADGQVDSVQPRRTDLVGLLQEGEPIGDILRRLFGGR